MDDFAEIRRLDREGKSARQIARLLHVGRDTIRKALNNPEPIPYTLSVPRSAPTFGPFRAIVDAILQADEHAPRKQRHTARQIFRRLQEQHGYTGSYDQVRRHLQQRRLARRETLVPLDHRPGVRVEADFGRIYVDFPDGRKLLPVLVMTWSYSNAPFAITLPTERTEAILHGMSQAFAFFQAVPQEVWWDNPTTVALQIGRGRERTLHPRYAALASHFNFTPQFCLPATPQEKPRVENRVKDLQRIWATPVPQVRDLASLNEHLRRCCEHARQRTIGSNSQTVGERFTHDCMAALPVPTRPFDACVYQSGCVDKYQTVAFDGNRYSVPRRWAFRSVSVKGFIDIVEIVADHHVVAIHSRSYDSGQRILNPLHFLAVLQCKPATLDHAPVYRDWQLPPALLQLRVHFEQRLGVRTGTRHYIRVLQLLASHPQDRIVQAIALTQDRLDAAAITTIVEQLARTTDPPNGARDSALSLQVPRPDLARFDALLTHSQGGENHDPNEHDVASGESEAVETADDLGRVREAGEGSSQPR